jgi:hypothetical protein
MPFFSNYFTTVTTSPEVTGDAELALRVPETQAENVGPALEVPEAQMEGDPPSTSEGVRCDPSIHAMEDDIIARDGNKVNAVC